MIVSAYSNRIYKNNTTMPLSTLQVDCNDIKIKVYADIINKKTDIKNLNTTYVIDKYHVNTYYANMIIREVKAILSSQEELQSIYLDDYITKIENQQAKIDKLEQKLLYWRNMKQEIISYIKNKQYKTVFPYTFKNSMVYKNNKIYQPWEFELYANKRIKQIKNQIYHAKNKLNRLNQKLNNLKSKTPVCCFGSKALFKKQFTVDKYINNHQLWKNEFQLKRHSHFTISGSKNHIDGSMCVRYDKQNNELLIMSHTQGIILPNKKYAKQEWFTVPCVFKYKEKEYLEALEKQETVAYEIIDNDEYFIIKAVFEYENPIPLLSDTTNGVNAIDINVDRYALVELDAKGNLLKRKVVYFDLENKTTNQSIKILEQAAIDCVEFCQKNGKPLVRENITKIKFKSTKDSKTNKELSQFAYDKMINTIDRCFYKNSIQVLKTNPAYTSQQGKIKYMAQMGLSIHESAAFCIGRRYMFSKYNSEGKLQFYYENMNQYSKFGTIKAIAKAFKKLKTDTIYKLKDIPININDFKKLNSYIKAVNDYIYNQEGKS